eukprot:scaffold81137_cov52-Attheya_sp.AAC.3
MNPHATTPHQVGGTVGFSFDQAAHRVDSVGGGRGQDLTGLGRWTWTKFRGKGQACLRAVVVYVPCVSSGPMTLWSQHMAYFNELNDTAWAAGPNPRNRLFADLGNSIKEWIAEGDHGALAARHLACTPITAIHIASGNTGRPTSRRRKQSTGTIRTLAGGKHAHITYFCARDRYSFMLPLFIFEFSFGFSFHFSQSIFSKIYLSDSEEQCLRWCHTYAQWVLKSGKDSSHDNY